MIRKNYRNYKLWKKKSRGQTRKIKILKITKTSDLKHLPSNSSKRSRERRGLLMRRLENQYSLIKRFVTNCKRLKNQLFNQELAKVNNLLQVSWRLWFCHTRISTEWRVKLTCFWKCYRSKSRCSTTLSLATRRIELWGNKSSTWRKKTTLTRSKVCKQGYKKGKTWIISWHLSILPIKTLRLKIKSAYKTLSN